MALAPVAEVVLVYGREDDREDGRVRTRARWGRSWGSHHDPYQTLEGEGEGEGAFGWFSGEAVRGEAGRR